MPTAVLLVAFLLGIAVGSFLNVVVYRLPKGKSALWPPSHCPRCRRPLTWRDNIPVLGWLILQGRCRYCDGRISPRYPIVELTTGLLFMLVAWRFDQPLAILGYCGLMSWLLALSLIDLDTMRLPNALTQSGLIAGLMFSSGLGWIESGGVAPQQFVAQRLVASMLAAVIGLWLFEGIAFAASICFGQTAMGGGDAKLAAMLGAWLGWPLLLLATFLACTMGALFGTLGLTLGLIQRRQAIPFGPFLALGAVVATLVGSLLISTYVDWFWPV
ncbi:MAG: prepilin peptidase [Elainellaceae cyanobacterium]